MRRHVTESKRNNFHFSFRLAMYHLFDIFHLHLSSIHISSLSYTQEAPFPAVFNPASGKLPTQHVVYINGLPIISAKNCILLHSCSPEACIMNSERIVPNALAGMLR